MDMRFALAILLLGCSTTRYSFSAYADEPRDPSETAARNNPAEPTVIEVGNVDTTSLLLPTLQLSIVQGPVLMVIDSPGGLVFAGLNFVEAMRAAQSRGVVITCYIPRGGMAASMGSYIFESCDRRVMHRQASILFHSVSIGSAPGGTVEDMERFARELRELNDRLAIHIAGRLTVPMGYLREKIRGDWWIGFGEALEVGAVDDVVN